MSETTTGAPNAFSAGTTSPDGDLSREVERSVPKQPMDRVRCVRVFGDHYRCNWWAPLLPAKGTAAEREISWATRATHHVRQSKFLAVTVREGVLAISEVKR